VATLLLNRSQVRELLDPEGLAEQLRAAFVAYSATANDRGLRVRASLPGVNGTATVLFPGTVSGLQAYSVKVHAKFPGQDPAIRGVLCLHDLDSGALLAIMDSTHLTAMRTGTTGALAAHVLARPDADTVAVIGAGVQGTFQLRALARLRTLRDVAVYDTRRDRAEDFSVRLGHELSLPVRTASSVANAVQTAQIILTATWATTPFILPGMLTPGAHVTTLGPDEPGKAEVSAEVIRSSLFVCDDRLLAVTLGALGGVGIGRDGVGAELGEVLAGSHPGRTSPDQVTVYGGVGLPFQDVIAAWHVYERARARGIETTLDFLE
jgi:ornithine cyclodeaminase/alanine dehydrogenase-like protein (mu-crystallin family)